MKYAALYLCVALLVALCLFTFALSLNWGMPLQWIGVRIG
jgi:hypothetical protein